LDDVPGYPTIPFNVNSNDVADLSGAMNFLYLIDPTAFGSKEAFLDALRLTDYDLLIIDAFYEDLPLTVQDTGSLKVKANGGERLVFSYMSIGEAEDYRYYWDDSWEDDPPSWLDDENPDWEGNYKVRYWDPTWQGYIYGNDGAYVDRILQAGFDGAYLDLIDAYEYYE
jgi:cysteinyl-tRNA synthetase